MNSIESNPKLNSRQYSKEQESGESSDFKLWNKAFGQGTEKQPNESEKIQGFTLSGIPEEFGKNAKVMSNQPATDSKAPLPQTQNDKKNGTTSKQKLPN